MTNKVIVHIDPAIGSTNLGDQIISEAINKQISIMFHDSRIISLSSRDVGNWAISILKKADFIFFGGSNALSSNPIFGYRQFSMRLASFLKLKNVILLGVGWWQYQDKFGPFAKSFYRKFLRDDFMHSVRDEYSKKKLNQLGFENIVNTGCPTMWDLGSFNTTVNDTVVLTLTDYNLNKLRDVLILKNALNKFDNVFLWPQGTDDYSYLQSFSSEIDIKRIKVINPTLKNFDEILSMQPCYVGTRLHAGIRALQHKCPTFIIPIDNRAVEIAKTESLILVDSDLGAIKMGDSYKFNHLKKPEIEKYTIQFGNCLRFPR